MFLVQLSCLLDDFPLRLFEDREKAEAFADSVEFETCMQQAENLWHLDASEPVCITVVEFNAEGVPVSAGVQRSYDDEPTPA